MSHETIKRIVLNELGLIDSELTEEQRIGIAIEIAIRLIEQSVHIHS